MTRFMRCLCYLGITGAIGFIMGRIIPKKWFTWNSFPWRPFSFEKNSRLYTKLRVKEWQSKVPDMSKIFRRLMPSKSMQSVRNAEQIKTMLRETCVAELVHVWLCFSSLHCLRIFNGIGGATVCLLYILGNIPFIVIQRYNRPRLNKLLSRLEAQPFECLPNADALLQASSKENLI